MLGMVKYAEVILLFSIIYFAFAEKINLNGKWALLKVGIPKVYEGNVPGDVYSDLFKQNVIGDPLYADNVIKYQWIGQSDWSYSRKISLSDSQLQTKHKVLSFEGLDTISHVKFNGNTVLSTNNMFLKYYVDVSDLVRRENILEVRFKSPVKTSKNLSDEYKQTYGHAVPPQCPPEIYHGECHINMIRKAQYHFSWDWGPSVATMGIWKPTSLFLLNEPELIDFSWVVKPSDDNWIVSGDISFLPTHYMREDDCKITVDGTSNVSVRARLQLTSIQLVSSVPFELVIPKKRVELWWPNGEGAQTLYTINVQCFEQEINKKIGFRDIQLVQSYVNTNNATQGRNFFFRVNDRPVFLKGSNWIPATMFVSSNYTSRAKFLLDSAAEVGMNALRVWGGGIYESEEFYNYANEKGILVWQDLMFACALYPINEEFLTNIKNELRQQIWRLRKHPSILLYAADNELEVAIRGHWFSDKSFSEEAQIQDYLKIRSKVIKPIVAVIDPTRPLLLSSPSNGNAEEIKDNLPSNPNDNLYGDIHNYDEFVDQWHDSSYPTPRCATEYGVQSLPFRRTMLKYLPQSDWYYSSPNFFHRQHHPGGVATNLAVVYTHFPISEQCVGFSQNNITSCSFVANSTKFLDRFSYFSQAHQAIMYKTQTEHYRRYRGRTTTDGIGNTMCALYWQLNDVWAAPTWSSIDFDLNWKIVHYEAKRFFYPIAVSLFASSEYDLGLAVINDTPDLLEKYTVHLKQFAWNNGFTPVYKTKYTVNMEPLAGKEISLDEFSDYGSDYLFAASIRNSEHVQVGYETVLLPDKLYEVDFSLFGDITVISVLRLGDNKYRVDLEATDLSPLTWVTCHNEAVAWFSDNGFTMTKPKKHIYLYTKHPQIININDITVCNLKTCGEL
ncbi:unnamed protein product [Auanema sp. JU1783]|nr:unnamed protein product [Auanema sp. JU1783]